MDKNLTTRKNKYFLLFSIAIILLVIIFILNIGLGSVHIGIKEILNSFFDPQANDDNELTRTVNRTIHNLRLPRTLAALGSGACIAVAGLLLQIFFRNPIVEPYILGVSSGSNFFVALVVLGGATFGLEKITSFTMFIGSFLGSLIIMSAVIFVSQRVKNIATLLIVGLMFGYICSAATSVLISLANKNAVATYSLWTMGSFAGFKWDDVKFLFIIATPFLIFAFFMAKPLNAMLLGENYAQSMGISIKTFRFFIILTSSVLTAVVTAYAGPVSFIGLACPHIVRMIFKTSDNRIIIPSTILAGAIMAGVCDLAARTVLAPTDLPLSAMTSIIGAPVILYLLISKKGGGDI